MALPNGYEQYNHNRIMMASPAELTLMLYEGAIKFLNVAIMGIEKSDMEKAHNNIQKAQRKEYAENCVHGCWQHRVCPECSG